MSSGFTAGFVTLLVSILLLAASCARIEGDETSAGTGIRYQSPSAVFDAYRDARNKREWRKCFSLLTAEAQNDAAFENFFACAMSQSKESPALVRKFVDLAPMNDEYEKKYKAKHGVDLAKLRAGHENDPTFVPPPQDADLFRDVVAAHVKDKAGFFEANANLLAANRISPLGDLEQLVVDGDTAIGRAKMTNVAKPVGSPRTRDTIYNKPFRFRRVDGGWLLDSL